MIGPLPSNEKRRLHVLWQYDVLDTVPEEVFDNLTELAARICEAPIALISLVDEDRQWFKAKIGTQVEETSRDVSFCAHAITQSDLFIVSDATKDSRFANNPLVTSEPKIRFYAGAPLITTDGYALGTLCVIDKVPRRLRPDQKQALTILARHVVSQLETPPPFPPARRRAERGRFPWTGTAKGARRTRGRQAGNREAQEREVPCPARDAAVQPPAPAVICGQQKSRSNGASAWVGVKTGGNLLSRNL